MATKKKAAGKGTTAVATETKKRSNLGGAARGAAVQRLIEMYPEGWATVLGEEREKVGLPAVNGRRTRLQVLADRMLGEGVDRETLNAALEAAGFKQKV